MNDEEQAPVKAKRKYTRRPNLGKGEAESAALRAELMELRSLVGQLQTGGGGMTPAVFMEAMQKQAEILRANKDLDEEVAARIHAQAMKKALQPENANWPNISAYNPQGERDHPRPKPTHIYMLAKYPICDPGNYDTTTWSELELLNQLKAGEYRVTKADAQEVKVLVKTEYDSAGKPYRTTLFADGKGIQDDEQKNNWPPLMQILTEMITGEAPMQSFARYQRIIEEQAQKIRELEGKLAPVA